MNDIISYIIAFLVLALMYGVGLFYNPKSRK